MDCNKCEQHEKNEHRITTLELRLDRYDENQIEIVKGQHEIRERVVKAEESTKSAHHRLDNMEEQTKAIIRLAVSVEHMSDKMDDILSHMKLQDDKINTQEVRIDKIENAPANAVFNYWKLFVGALVTGTAGVMLGTVLKNLFGIGGK